MVTWGDKRQACASALSLKRMDCSLPFARRHRTTMARIGASAGVGLVGGAYSLCLIFLCAWMKRWGRKKRKNCSLRTKIYFYFPLGRIHLDTCLFRLMLSLKKKRHLSLMAILST